MTFIITTTIFQIEYKIFLGQNRGTRMIILLPDKNDFRFMSDMS